MTEMTSTDRSSRSSAIRSSVGTTSGGRSASATHLVNGAAAAAMFAAAFMGGTTVTPPVWRAPIFGAGGTSAGMTFDVDSLTARDEEVAVEAEPTTQADRVRWLHERSGLTWDQLGKVFGVSRRAVHLWANGGRMNSANATTLAELATAVRALPVGGPDEVRAALLASGPNELSIVDRFRLRAADSDINGSPYAPADLFDAQHRSGSNRV